jgi:predicted RNase H-like HicB family nuclease
MDENLSEILNISPEPTQVVQKQDFPIKEVDVEMDDVDKDFQRARQNLKELINLGFVAIDGVLKVASEGDSPRAYEVVAQMLKSVAETNKDLVELHQRMKSIKQEKYEKTVNNTTNAIFVGSTRDLQELINPKRSFAKAIQDTTDLIEGSKKVLDDERAEDE